MGGVWSVHYTVQDEQEVVLKFANGLEGEEGLEIFEVSIQDFHDMGGMERVPNRISSSRNTEARFFLSILESSVRNSLNRKRRLEGKSEEQAQELVSEVTDLVGMISLTSSEYQIMSRMRARAGVEYSPGIRLESFLSIVWDDLSSSMKEQFPNLSRTKKREFVDIFSNDLTSSTSPARESTERV